MLTLTRSLLLALALLVPTQSRADFDVADNYLPLRYVASAEQTSFSVTWPFEADADLKVYTSVDEGVSWSLETLDDDYTVTGEGTSNGGAVVFGTGRAVDTLVMVLRNDGIDRTSDFTTITPTGLNLHLDRQTTQIQQVEDIAENRAVQFPFDDDYSGDGISPVLPSIVGKSMRPIVAKRDESGVTYGPTSVDDWGCLECPPAVCVGGANAGEPCAGDAECPGGVCGDGFENCDYVSVIDGTLTCANGTCPDSCGGGGGGGVCTGGANDGDACAEDADCPGGDCDGPGACLDCGPRGVCDGGSNDGASCVIDTDCPSGTCVFVPDGVCFGGSGDGDPCTDDADCAGGGTCRPNNDVCLGGANDGDACTTDADCPGGVCIDGRDRCDGGTDDGELCQYNSDCAGGGICAACRTCFGGGSADQVCDLDLDCPSGICMSCSEGELCVGGSGDGDACTDDADCAGGGVCSLEPDGVGVLGPASSSDDAFARWDGTSGRFIKDSTLKMQAWGVVTGAFGYATRPLGVTATSQSVTLSYPYSATNSDLYADAAAWYWYPTKSPGVLEADLSLPTEVQMNWVAASNEYAVTGETDATQSMTPTFWSASTYPVTVFQPGLSTNAQLVARIYFPEPVICPDNWVGSEVWTASTFTGSATYNFQKNGSTVGTAVFGTGAAPLEATLATSGTTTSFAAGDFLDIDAPGTADATGGNLSFTLLCYRSISNEDAQ